jgi:DNA-binding beta-propeller fold protein YncE
MLVAMGRRGFSWWLLLTIAAGVGLLAWAGTGRDAPRARQHPQVAAPQPPPPAPQPATAWRLATRPAGALTQPVQDTAATYVSGRGTLLIGGLTAADTSTGDIRRLAGRRDHLIGALSPGRHDAAAVTLNGTPYILGGGDGIQQLDEILRVDPATGRTSPAGRLPAPSSDHSAAVIGDTAYVVGGFTGARWLDTIVAWRPGSGGRVVAHLPTPVRYAAVTSVGGHLVVAGGSKPDGTASDAVFEYTPGSDHVVRLGRLPAPTTHAAAVADGGLALIVGGRGAALGSLSSRIVGIDSSTGRIHTVGRLGRPLADAAAVSADGRILLIGGRTPRGTGNSVLELRKVTARAPDRTNVYAADGAGMLTGPALKARPLIYVPNSGSNTVEEIDPRTRRVVRQFAVPAEPQHVVPSWDLRTLYVTSDLGNAVTPIDPRTGRPRAPIPVPDPYNLYFTPDGRSAIVVAERLHRLDFRNPRTFRLQRSVAVPCSGVDHIDFSASGRYLLATCEFSGQVIKVGLDPPRMLATITLPDGQGGMPQDIKLSPDGRLFYVADMMANGLWTIDGDRMKVTGFIPTGTGVHGLYPSRDARYLYATNRGAGSVSVISFRTRRVVSTWHLPGGGSPDMGGVSADGRTLWVSGRYNAEVYEISTRNGRLLARIPVGVGPHGVCVWPQPGRHSLGHTGILR